MLSRLVTGLMDKLEQKLGREGLRVRVRTVASQAAKVRGKENLRVSCVGGSQSRAPGSPLRTAPVADNLPALSPRSPNDLVPKLGEKKGFNTAFFRGKSGNPSI